MAVRLGPQRQTGANDAELREWVRIVNPPWVKCVDEWPRWLADEVHAYGGKLLGRLWLTDAEQELTPAAVGAAIARIREKALAHPWVDAWEFHNEAHDSPAEMAVYAVACLGFIEAMRAIGKIAVVGCFAHGTPELAATGRPPEWPAFRPVLDRAAADPERVYVAFHEYGPGDNMAAFVPWNVHRHKLAIAEWAAMGLPSTIRVLITECLVDDVPQGTGKFGYRMWPGCDYPELLRQYCAGVHPAVKGVMDFGWGGWPGQPEPKASSYNLALGDWRRAAQLQLTIAQLPPGGNMNEKIARAKTVYWLEQVTRMAEFAAANEPHDQEENREAAKRIADRFTKVAIQERDSFR